MDRNVDPLGYNPPAPGAVSLAPPERRHARRLFDKIMVAFHHACDARDLEVSERLLALLELMATRRPRPEDGNRRRTIENLVAAHERLWHLRRPRLD